MELIFFQDLVVILFASLLVTVLFNRFGIPGIIASLVAGCVIGPYVFDWVRAPDDFDFIAEFGVVFLLFSLGLEFSLPKLMALRSSVLGLGSAQVLICSLVFGGAVYAWGVDLPSALIIGGALTFSSTAIVTRELSAGKRVHTRQGQLAIGVLLFQDVVAVFFLILVPVLAVDDGGGIWRSLGAAMGKSLLLLVGLLSVGKWLLPPLYREVARGESEEVFVLSTVVIVLLAAWVTHYFHVSMALGGFVIGMMLGESQFRHQINSDIQGFKIILLGLFFTTVGMSIQVGLLVEYGWRILTFTVMLIAIKTLLISVLVRLLGDDRSTALQTGLILAQAGEFGLALLALGVMHDVLPHDQASFIILVAVCSMAVSPLLMRYSSHLSRWVWSRIGRHGGADGAANEVTFYQKEHVIVGGFGRVGNTVVGMLDRNGINYIAIDNNAELVEIARDQGFNVMYGDCSRLDILRRCHIDTASMAILTFRSIAMAKDTIQQIRASGMTLPLVVRCYEHGNYEELILLGADHVVPEMLEASLAISAQVLHLLGIRETDIERQIDRERRAQLELS
jgi:CPA2 family monovalent cation:H+ antiporter-2